MKNKLRSSSPNYLSCCIPMEKQGTESVVVVVVPFPAQGHLNQLLHLSRLISARGLPVHFVGAATHNRQAKVRVEGWDPHTLSAIHFHDLPLPSFPALPPNPNARNKFPTHLQPAFDASVHLRHPLSAILHSLSSTSRRIAVIHDDLMSFAAQEAANHPNTEAYAFHACSAFAYFFINLQLTGKDGYTNLKIPQLPPLSLEGCFTQKFLEFMYNQEQMMASAVGHIYDTCGPVEGEYIDLVAQGTYAGEKLWAMGPFNPISLQDHQARHHCLEWLDKQPHNSVIYVSFGTMSSISDEQIRAIAIGLERSKQRFIWVVREADKADIFAQGEKEENQERKIILPQRYEERVGEMGRVLRDWAPQMEILGHPSVGGFMSHCGWNSCMESISMGVAILAWPMHSDQPRNAMLLTDVLRVGVMVREWSKREELVTAEAVDNALTRLMESDEGKGMRKRARELGRNVRQVWSEGGSSRHAMDDFIAHISREV